VTVLVVPPPLSAASALLTNPALWSAVAAFFSAGAAFLMVRIQRRSLLESVRPEVIVTLWQRSSGEGGDDILAYPKIRNVGRGAAYNVAVWTDHAHIMDPLDVTPILGPLDEVPILAPGDSEILQYGRLILWWKNLPGTDAALKALSVKLKITCSDARNVQHTTEYRLHIIPLTPDVSVAHEVAAGVMVTRYGTRSAPRWRVRARAAFDRMRAWRPTRPRFLRRRSRDLRND
jgi:hypothetical protein